MSPVFSANPFDTQNLIIAGGSPGYCFGSFARDTAPSKFYVTNSAGDGTHATLGVTLREGNIPVAGQLVSVRGTAATAGGPYNVTNVAITSVTGFSTGDNSKGSILFLNTTSQASLPDVGEAMAPQAEVGDTVAVGASKAFNVQTLGSALNQGRALKATVIFPTLPTAAIVTLQDAIDLTDTFTDMATVASVAGGVLTGGSAEVTITAGRWYRFNITGVNGAGTIVAKLAL
jgi:hypothetical protein